jgi:pimeloyl-ACP methyl ester carboxylesterase
MNIMSKKRIWPLVTGGLFLLLAAAYTFKSFTMPIFAQGAIGDLFELDVNGDVQYLLIRGVDRKQPVMLFVHGGPGMPAMFLAHDFQRDLEGEFVVVHWDQRASGKSFKRTVDQVQLSTSLLLSDMDAVIDYLRGTLDAHRVWVVGHSHGSYLGALYARRHPEKVCAFVGVGQVVGGSHSERTRAIQEEFLQSQLESLGLAPDTVINDSNLEELLFLTGGELYGETSYSPLLMSGLMAPEYSLFDVLNVARGSSFSSKSMVYDMPRDLLASEWQFDVPVAMIMGRHDMVTPIQLSKEYYERIEAPTKAWYVFEKTSHFSHYEKPRKFTEALVELKSRWGDCRE